MGSSSPIGWRRRLRAYTAVVAAAVVVKAALFVWFVPIGGAALADGDRDDVVERRNHLVALLADAGPPSSPLLDERFADEWRIVALSMTALETA
ncbi:MAG: hypothetical protein FJ137_13550 [Deltaproteobacteria bacterium]|nr:hypothetical protein [Deltaproteobacteria bacterium]